MQLLLFSSKGGLFLIDYLALEHNIQQQNHIVKNNVVMVAKKHIKSKKI